ncbi:MAG: hypothetical protein M1818_002463 [Claussenomyces sp. TS43310]|nr:MAG: hypothetical protein M1818_002463 [Claussenomyces sp. TS43310]
MIVRPTQLRPLPSFLLPFAQQSSSGIQTRCLHHRLSAPKIPTPTPFVPDAQTFLTLIGRNLAQHAAKFPSWEALFSLSSAQMRELGIEPPRSRRYLLRWREKFRKGEYGICGDVQSVVDGAAEVRVVEVPKATAMAPDVAEATTTSTPRTHKMVVNLPPGTEPSAVPPEKLNPVKGLKIKGAHTIIGPHIQPVRGAGGQIAKIIIKEGLWEDRRGRKIDGGERRQAEVRAKRRSEERKNAR